MQSVGPATETRIAEFDVMDEETVETKLEQASERVRAWQSVPLGRPAPSQITSLRATLRRPQRLWINH